MKFLDKNRLQDYQFHTPEKLFCVSATIGALTVLTCFFLSHGELIDNYFFWDTRDTGMDFFHSIIYVRGRNPYAQFDTLYPPMANLFFLLIYYLTPEHISANWPNSYVDAIYEKGTQIDLRTHQATFLCFIVVIMIAAWAFTTLCLEVLDNKSRFRGNWVAMCALVSPGVLYCYERGNILFLVIPMIVFFVKYRNDERWYMRELAMISLAIAAGLKLYPAFFGVLLLRDRQYKQAARTVLYGILSVVLPMLVFKEGLGGILQWIQIVLAFGSSDPAPWTGLGFANILYRFAAYANNLFGFPITPGLYTVAGYLMAAALLVLSLMMKKEWQSLLAISAAFIMFQNQGVYALSMFILPMLWFIREEECITRRNILPFAAMTMLLTNVPVFYVVNDGVFHVSRPDAVYRQLFSMIIVLWCFWEVIGSRRKDKRALQSL